MDGPQAQARSVPIARDVRSRGNCAGRHPARTSQARDACDRTRALRRADGALAARHPQAGAPGARGRRRAVRVDRRRAPPAAPAPDARRHGRDHQRPEAVRGTRVTDRLDRRSTGVIETLPSSRVADGETTWERFEALYRSARADLYAYVATLLRDPAAAEDITALAFERAYRRRRSFDRRRGEERAWLFGIARNAALDELRRRQRVAALAVDPQDTPGVGPEDVADVALRRTAVRTALGALSARDRELIALKFHAGLPNAEIARVLGISESNAGTLLHRAIE